VGFWLLELSDVGCGISTLPNSATLAMIYLRQRYRNPICLQTVRVLFALSPGSGTPFWMDEELNDEDLFTDLLRFCCTAAGGRREMYSRYG
jgi:hypothetical protein